MKTAKIDLDNIKCSDGWVELGDNLGFTRKKIADIFEWSEFGNITIEVDENLNIVGGKIRKFKK